MYANDSLMSFEFVAHLKYKAIDKRDEMKIKFVFIKQNKTKLNGAQNMVHHFHLLTRDILGPRQLFLAGQPAPDNAMHLLTMPLN